MGKYFIYCFSAALLVSSVGCDLLSRQKTAAISYRQLLSNLADLDYLARLDVPGTSVVASSDPAGGNDLPAGPEGWIALADLKGPGYVSRFWAAGSDPQQRLRLFFDNEKTPRIDLALGEFCGGTFPFIPPLAVYENYGWYNYVPIPYARRLVIMTQKGGSRPDGGPKPHHQVNYISLPKTARVESFDPKLMSGNFRDAARPACPSSDRAAHALPTGFSDQEKVGRGVPALSEAEGPAEPSGEERLTRPSSRRSGAMPSRTGGRVRPIQPSQPKALLRRSRPGWNRQKLDPDADQMGLIQCLQKIAEQWKNPGQFQCPVVILAATNIQLAAGQKGSVVSEGGPAIIRELIIAPEFGKIPAINREAVLRDVILKISWDDRQEPSVAVPLGGFFGSGWDTTSGQGMFFGRTNDSFYCRFPMPYRSRAVITLENQMSAPAGFRLTIKGRKLETRPPGYGFFHAAWRRSTEKDIGRPHTVLNVGGKGRYAGCILGALSLDKSFRLLEGDESMTRDDEPLFSGRGTGLADYFNADQHYQNVLCRPLSGLPAKSFFRTAQYRVHLPDPVMFNRSFQMTFERGPGNNSRGWMESVAFYYLDRPRAAASDLLTPPDRRPPVDEAQKAGFMLELFNYERFGDYRGALFRIEAYLARNPDTPSGEMLELRRAAYIERMEGIEKARPLYEKIRAGVKDPLVKGQARMLAWFHENPGNAILGLYANTPAKCFLDGRPLVESLNPAMLAVASLNLKPGRHVLALQCRYHPDPAWVQACLRTHSGPVITDSSWKQMVDPSGDWAAVDYNDSSWQVTGGTGGKGPPEEPFVLIDPNAYVDMQSQAKGLFCSIPWPDKSKPLVLRHVFELPEKAK